jgi:Mn2+/Fe2+ NRAMP family transporter
MSVSTSDNSQAPVDPEAPTSAAVPTSKPRLLSILGPGLITGASDDDPSGIATYSQTGAQFGYDLAWTMVLTYPLMCAIQVIAARFGRTTGRGLAGVLRQRSPVWLLLGLVALILVANVLNIAADLGAMGDGLRLVIGGPKTVYVIGFGAVCALMEVFLKYSRYVSVLKWLALSLLAYVATLFMTKVDWSATLRGLLIPMPSWNKDYLATIVAVFGTTISPYLFFWQASQEAEDVRAFPRRKILLRAPEQGEAALSRIQIDTYIGMAFSNLIALSIMATAAATLNANHVTNIQTSAQAAAALKPVAGVYAESLFALGIVSTGLLAIPVFAGSAAYAIGEARRWPTGLDRRPTEAKAFYATIVVATAAGVLLNFSPIDPIRALFWSAVVNGIVAVPVMIVIMLLAGRSEVLGDFVVRGWLKWLGWAAAGAMAIVVVAMITTAI